MKLQKLVYYSQSWSLVWDERPLFNEAIEAWVNGPVVPELYSKHRGRFKLLQNDLGPYMAGCLDETAIETIDAVLQHYGEKSSQWLSDLSHAESPWRDARDGLPLDERGNRVISHASLAEFYGGLQ